MNLHFKLLEWTVINVSVHFSIGVMLFLITSNCIGIFAKWWTFFQQLLCNFKFHLWFEFEFRWELKKRYWTKVIKHSLAKWLGLITEGYCSMTLGALQISSTIRNLVPRFKREVKGEGSGYEILGSVLGLGCSSRRGWSITLMSSFCCFRSSWWSCRPFFGNSIVLTKE